MSRERGRKKIDLTLLMIAIFLLTFGLATLYSASAILADREFGDPLHFMKRQVIFTGAGLSSLYLLSRLDYNRLREWIWPLMAVTVMFLTAVLFAPPIAGVNRWIRIGGFTIQPAEFAKLTVIIFLADYLDRKRSKVSNMVQGMIVPWTVVGVMLLLIGLGPDLGTPALLFSVGMIVLFIGGTSPKHIGATILCALPVLAFELIHYPYRRARLLNFLSPSDDPSGAGYQLAQSLLAVGSGGWGGTGLGGSKLKLMYLPTPHTDFIFPVLCEELGLAGAAVVLGLFTAFLFRGMKVARSAPDLYGTLLAAGLTFLICLQAFFNISMSLGLLPTKGMPLPFFSYGGSSLLVTLSAVGILLNISRHSSERAAR